ncbi:MAG: methylmalonyl-CoA epimerase [Candidatus Glassbacteria bacterium]
MDQPSIDHIGIAVGDLDEASAVFRNVLGVEESHREEIVEEGVAISIFELATTRIELISPLDGQSPISKFLSTRGPGIHHIAIQKQDIRAHHQILLEKGFSVIGQIRSGGEGREVFFLHPNQTFGVLIEYTSPPSRGSGR